MGDLVNFNHNQQDPAQILLAAFYHNLFDLGHTRTNSYLEAKNAHPNEFAAISVRARNNGHQEGVVGDTYLGREEIVLKGHHNHLQRGVCESFGRTTTCIIMKYITHNHPGIAGGFYYGGAGADIRKAHSMGLRILRHQVWNEWNRGHASIIAGNEIRCYVFHSSHKTYEYVGLVRAVAYGKVYTE
ncbi:hypothetical protein POM88_033966 [Heracleum sosnowskyi]|uniref:Uncharacterized protein n=1 Tax=Heracleum sosnowskyi TaxID=360622 RepID=A0AAD8HKD6_9APIA|nr:hypothetical protein POM88_033966 [Heracleum sosnowskyi]